VCHLSMVPYVLGIYLHLGSSGLIVHCYDGVDEICTAAAARLGIPANNLVVRVDGDRIMLAECGPEDLGLPRSSLQDLAEEGTVAESSLAQWSILAGEPGPKRDFLVANAAVMLVAGDAVADSREDLVGALRSAARLAEHLLDSGAAHRNFADLVGTAGG
jgi:anthranilate phosphoribosyltransferase